MNIIVEKFSSILKKILVFGGGSKFDITTEGGRSNERYRRITLSSLTSMFSKVIGLFANIISIPLTVNYFGSERFGLWATLSSILVILNIIDLGLGTGLINKVSYANGIDSKEKAKEYVSNVFFILIIQSIIMLALVFIVYPNIHFDKIFKLKTLIAIKEVGPSILCLFVFYFIKFPLVIVQKIQDGFQEGYINYVFNIVNNILTVLFLFIIVHFKLGLPWLIFAFIGIQSIVLFFNYLFLFYLRRSWLRPNFKLLKIATIKELFDMGMIFFVLNFLTIIGLHSDNVLISIFKGAVNVSSYAIVLKLSRVAFIYWSFNEALWPAYGEALSRKDFNWLRKTIVSAFKISLVGGIIIGLVLILFGRKIVLLWVGNALEFDASLFWGFAAFVFVHGFLGVIAVVFNSTFLYRKQFFPYLLATICTLIIKFIILKNYSLNYLMWGSIIGYGIFYIIPGLFMIKKYFFSDKLEYGC